MAAPCQPSSSVPVESSGHIDSDPELLPVTRSSLLARQLMRLRTCSSHVSPVRRRKREMIPADKKDATYWDKRRKNNEAAKRSREKRRLNDLMLEGHLLALSEENAQLRAQVLNLHYHTTLHENKAASAPSGLASTFHTPAVLQAGLWGNSRSNPASVVPMRQQEAMHQYETKIPRFGSAVNVLNPLSHHKCGPHQGIFPLPGPRVLPSREALGGRRSAEAEADAQRQVSSSDDIPISNHAPSQSLSSLSAFLPTPDTHHHAPSLPYPPQNWLVPHLNHSVVCNNLLLPWRPSYLAPPAVYPGLPLHIQERQGQGLGVDPRIQRGFKNRFNSAHSVGMHLNPNGR